MRFVAIAIWCLSLMWLFYGVEQSDFVSIICGFAASFGSYVFLNLSGLKLRDIFVLALFVRLISLAAFPALSDDIYRFVWDGCVIQEGLNPYEHKPSEIRGIIGREDLFEQLNSPNYYSVYPAINQVIFYLSSLFKPLWLSVLFIRLTIAGFEIGFWYLALKWLRRYNLSDGRLAWIILNPLLIVETYCNLHFEMVMVFFLMLAILWIEKPVRVGIALGLSAASKLLSFIAVPLLIFKHPRRWDGQFLTGLGITTALLFFPIFQLFFTSGFWQSLDLYFRTFEFNAGLYYMLRWIGFELKGYNTIHILGPGLAMCSAILILTISYLHRNRPTITIPQTIALLFTIYLMFATTVHPWYVITPLVFGILGGLRYPIIWSFLIILSYHAYANDPVCESDLWILVQYVLLWGFLLFEMIRIKPREDQVNQNPESI